MNKPIVIIGTVIKIVIQSWFLVLVYQSARFSDHTLNGYQVIGQFFLISLGTLLVTNIVIDILRDIIVTSLGKKEKSHKGEWEKQINKQVLQNFSYAFSLFISCLMLVLSMGVSIISILFIIIIGFIILTIVVDVTKLYYYH